MDCLYRDRVMRVVLWASREISWTILAEKRLRIDLVDRHEYARWVGRARWVQVERGTNGVAVWDVIVQSCYPSRDGREED